MTTRLLHGDCRDILPTLPDASVHCVITSPPYFGLRDYGTGTWEGGDATGCDHQSPNGQGATGQRADRTFTANSPYKDTCGKCGARRIDRQIGLEATPDEYLATMVAVFREVKRILRDDGCVFCNLGDSYSNKQLQMMPARLAIALQADGWWLRSDIIWAKPNPMPESCTDRPASAHEHVFMLTKSARYFYDAIAVAERVTQARVGKQSDFEDKRLTLGDDLRLHIPTPNHPSSAEARHSRLREIGVRIASLIFDLAKTQDQICLFPLDAKEWVDRTDKSSCLEVASMPVISRAAAQSRRFTNQDITAEEFLDELHSLWVALPDGDHLREAWRPAFTDRLLVITDGDGAVGINDASDIGEFKLSHNEIDTSIRDGIQTRNLRNVWTIPTQAFPGSHFATMPTALVERCIRAGTSERGCCAACGAPWVRSVSVEYENAGNGNNNMARKGADFAGSMASRPYEVRKLRHASTTGWTASCACDAAVVPCTVLDPFAGAGTTLLVADRLQRDAIGIELSAPYTAMGTARVVDDAPLLAWLDAAQ